jgi:hypothetical protein
MHQGQETNVHKNSKYGRNRYQSDRSISTSSSDKSSRGIEGGSGGGELGGGGGCILDGREGREVSCRPSSLGSSAKGGSALPVYAGKISERKWVLG